MPAAAATPVLYLASQSPRRRELLLQIGIAHRVIAIDVDETPHPHEAAALYVERLARAKAAAGWAACQTNGESPLPVLGADTVVVLAGEILGKPRDADDGRAMLRRLSGNCHDVLTGVSLCGARGQIACVSATRVWFRPLSAAEIEWYWASGEPCDKAGAYGIQGLAARFVERMEGSYSGVVGLPLFETDALLRRYDSDAIDCD
ncbi:MAG TPA: Maf family protein [Spongiibacteraceae bacterium]|nr:Maf family protein [Spongiibacteraceae bacterium]